MASTTFLPFKMTWGFDIITHFTCNLFEKLLRKDETETGIHSFRPSAKQNPAAISSRVAKQVQDWSLEQLRAAVPQLALRSTISERKRVICHIY